MSRTVFVVDCDVVISHSGTDGGERRKERNVEGTAQCPISAATINSNFAVSGKCLEGASWGDSDADRGGAHVCNLQFTTPCPKDVAVLFAPLFRRLLFQCPVYATDVSRVVLQLWRESHPVCIPQPKLP